MKKKYLYKMFLVAAFVCCTTLGLRAQESFITSDNVAVFYPSNFESGRLMPSLAVIKDLPRSAALPSNWFLKPVYSMENGKQVVEIPIGNDVDLYGTGEIAGNLRRNGTETIIWCTDSYGYTRNNGTQLYQAHPWVLGVRANGTSFGVIFDSSWKMTISMNNPVKMVTDGPAPRVIIIEGQTPDEVLIELANLTGTIEMPPLWALGYQQCRYSYFPQEQVKEIATEFRNRNIPCDVIWMDIHYMEGYRVFTFNKRGFNDPKGTNDYLHSLNFKTVYMIDPGVKKDNNYFVYQQGSAGNHWIQKANGTEYNGDVWPGECAFPDFTRPQTQEWWSSLYKGLADKGVDGVWNDMNEPAVFRAKESMDSCIHRGGGELPQDIHKRYHNVYGLLMTKAGREGMLDAKPNNRPFVLSRANFLGGHRYSATWTGDNASTWDYLRLSIPMSINLSLSGQAFNGADIGGFGGNATGDLLAHWTAIGVYYPFARNHSQDNSVQQEPWVFGQEVENSTRTSINRRYRLMPYIYTQMFHTTLNGMPMMRPAFMYDLTNLALRNEQEVFGFGADLLVIPRWASPHLPSGDWDILKMEDEDDGIQPYLALRSGAIVPTGEVIQSTEDYNLQSLTLLVNPAKDGSAQGQLYSDSGDGFGYKEGDYALYDLKATKKGKKLTVKIEKVEGKRTENIRFRVGYVIDNQIIYSDYTNASSCKVNMVNDPTLSLDVNNLKMSETQFPDKDLSKSLQRRGRRLKPGENY